MSAMQQRLRRALQLEKGGIYQESAQAISCQYPKCGDLALLTIGSATDNTVQLLQPLVNLCRTNVRITHI